MKILIPLIALILAILAISASAGLMLFQPPATDSGMDGSAAMDSDDGMMDDDSMMDGSDSGSMMDDQDLPIWLTAELTDVSTGETFRLSDFEGTPVLLESFAVWCPICLSQQREMEKLLAEDVDVIHVSLDTDPNEDESNIRSHLDRHGFSWRFAVASPEVTQSLREQFGLGVVNAPSAPVILIDSDLNPTFLRSGVKPASELLEQVRGA